MCLNIKKDQQPQIAETNLPCYKELKKDNCSENQGYQYIKGQDNPTIALNPVLTSSFYYPGFPRLEKGYHSYTPDAYKRYHSHLFIIPAGAEYYIGGINDHPIVQDGYTSNKIIFVGKNNWWNRFWRGRKYGVKFYPKQEVKYKL